MTYPKMWLSWETYQKNICNGLGLLQQRGEFVDMTVAADGHHVKVHQMIMSLISPYIKELITSAQCPHPVIFLNKISYQTLESLLEYAYTGEVVIEQDRVSDFLEACASLQIKGLENNMSNKTNSNVEWVSDDVKYKSTSEQETDPSVQTWNEKQNEEIDVDNDHLQISTAVEPPMDDNDNNYYNDDDDDENDEIQTVADNALNKSVPKDTKKVELGSMLKYSLSNQGAIQLVLNRYIFSKRYTRRNKEQVWRCINYFRKACPAFVITNGDLVTHRECAHNHAYHDKMIMKRILNGNMFAAYNAVESVMNKEKLTRSSTDSKS